MSFDLFFQGEVDIVCGCDLVSTFSAFVIKMLNIRGVGMLSMIAAEKRPDAFGDINMARTAPAPALCPKIVMREGSPPKACVICQSESRYCKRHWIILQCSPSPIPTPTRYPRARSSLPDQSLPGQRRSRMCPAWNEESVFESPHER